jgi:PWWP domain-containing protein
LFFPSASEPAETPEKLDETSAADSADKAKAAEEKDIEMKDATETQESAATADDAAEPKTDGDASTVATGDADGAATLDKSKDKLRRKSGSVPEHKGKKLNKKGSKARITNLGAQPGDQFLMKLKGYPPWPVIICDEDMLPQSLLLNRPVAAKRPDGTYREDFADGGKRAHDRVFPVMYLYTNEL